MAGVFGAPETPLIGQLLVQGGSLSLQVRAFLESADIIEGRCDSHSSLQFYVLPESTVIAATEEGLIPTPAVWVDAEEAAEGIAALQVVYRLGGCHQMAMLPFKPVRLQTNRKPPNAPFLFPAYKAYVAAKVHIRMYRLMRTLFPTLQAWDKDLRDSHVMLVGSDTMNGGDIAVGQILAKPVEQGLLLEQHSAATGVTSRVKVIINFYHACIELQNTALDEPTPTTLAASYGSSYGSASRCLRTVHTLAEAVAALKKTGHEASPSISPIKQPDYRAMFQSPAKPPHRPAAVDVLARDGVALVQACSSAQLRDGAMMLQGAAVLPSGAAACVSAGAFEALVSAAASISPSTIMGPTEQLSLLTLTVAALLDASSPECEGPRWLVAAFSNALLSTCANPVLLCKLAVALLQRPDVRLEAMRQDLSSVISAAYLRKAPLLEPLASALLSPTALRTGRRKNGSMASPSERLVRAAESGDGRARSPSHLGYTPRLVGSKFSVPRLSLPSMEEAGSTATPLGGLTRATRREAGAGAPGTEWRSPAAGSVARSSADWASPRPCNGARDTPASEEMASMAEALGENLMAMDLPAAVAFKRQADAERTMAAHAAPPEDLVPAELLVGQQPLTAKHQVLQAHRIFASAHSVDASEASSSDENSAVSAHAGGGNGAVTASASHAGVCAGPDIGLLVADAAEVKCLLLHALDAALPLTDDLDAPSQDPSALLAAELLSMPSSPSSSNSLSVSESNLREACLNLLSRLALRAEGRAVRDPAAPCPHIFLVATGTKLMQLLGGGSRLLPVSAMQAAALMSTIAEYLTAVNSPASSVAVVSHCLPAVMLALNAVQSGGAAPSRWHQHTWQLLHSVVSLLTPAVRCCEDPECGRALIDAILGDFKVASMFLAVSEVALLHEDMQLSSSQRGAAPARHPVFQRDLLVFFTAVINLLSRQPRDAGGHVYASSSSIAGTGGSFEANGDDLGNDVLVVSCQRSNNNRSPWRRLTRRHALNFFAPLLSPGNALVRRVLDHGQSHGNAGGGGPMSLLSPTTASAPPTTSAVRLRPLLFDFLRAAYSARGGPFAADKPTADYYVRFHFIQFLKLYHNPHRDHQATFLCRQHVAALVALAGAGRNPNALHIRQRFQQLAVVDFFIRELSLEFESMQPGRAVRAESVGAVGLNTVDAIGSMTGKTLLTAGRAASAGLLLGAKHSPSATGSSHMSGAATTHKRTASFSATASVAVNSEDEGTPTGRVPKLRLPSTLRSTVPGDSDTSTSMRGAPYPTPTWQPSSRRGSPRGRSRLGRTEPGVAAAMHTSIPGVQAATRQVAERSAPAGGTVDSPSIVCTLDVGKTEFVKRLETATSQAISVDGTWPTSANSDSSMGAAQPSSLSRKRRSGSADSVSHLPSGFAFSGDLDEDVELLEALERDMATDGDDGMSTSTTSSSDGSFSIEATPSVHLPAGLKLKLGTTRTDSPIPPLSLPPPSSEDTTSISSTLRLPNSPPPRPSGPPVPLLAITPSMHSTLEARTASAELEVAAEAERARRKAGRSFFGDLEASALGKGKMQAATGRRGSTRTPTRGAHSPLPGIAAAAHYAEQRAQRLLHRDDELHLQSLVLLFTLLLNPSGQLDTAYCDPYPWDRKLQNAPFILHHHLNHPQNRGLLPKLLPAIHSLGLPAVRLLRTLCAAFFRPSWYSQKTRISGVAGAYATVYRCALPRWAGGGSVVLKLLDTPEHIQDRCVQVDYHSEVTILEALTKRPSACQIYDYGLDPQGDALHLVLKDYRCSLKQWRMAQPEDPGPRLRLYYAIYREIVVAVGELLQAGVVHFDLKCDNVLLEPLPGRSSLEFWTPTSATPPFRVVLADFGESKLFPKDGGEGRSSKNSLVGSSPATTSREGLGMMSNSDAAVTSRARGTDAFKSPEMLLVGGAPQKHDRRFDRRRRRGAGAASDVWSLGCLLYELITGKLLFGDSDWLQLVARVTSPGMQLITEERAALVKDLPGVLDLLQYILVRDASLRPTLADTLRQVDATLALHGADLPRHGVGMNVQGAVPVPEESPLAATTSGTEGFQQTPLPLVDFAQIAPGVHVGLLGCATAETIRARKVSRVVALVARREQYRGEDRRTKGGKGSPLEVEMPLRDALADEQLVDCLDACLVGGAGCNVLRAPSQDASSAEILPWIKYVLEIDIDDQYSDERGETMGGSDDGNIVLVAGPGAEGGAALLCVALLVHRRRYSMYEAMVAASHWNLDLHLGAGDIEALELWSRARSLGRRGVADWKN